jgi:hypothetical protein
MTYFETPNDKAAYIAGMSTAAYEDMLDRLAEEEEMLWDLGQPHLDVEDRDLIPEGDVALVTQQDREDLQTVLDWEDFGGFHNP